MAILSSGKLTLEITYAGWEDEWLFYDIHCRWDGKPIFADGLLHRDDFYKAVRKPGALLVQEYKRCCFLPMFDALFDKCEAQYAAPIDSYVVLAVYPDGYFPFLESHWQPVFMSPEMLAEKEAKGAERAAAGGVRDADYVQLIFAFDTYCFDGTSYSMDGPAMHMSVVWSDLKAFAAGLREEFDAFAEANAIPLNPATYQGEAG